ncbi:MAG: hypothetical protein JOY62_17805 [Acidobacteriaceae bacterium]|nr:hypothetical protein [Acidobacteriaceae bacterium]MBV9781822.1 hypothetical protein [Acidobacteriaceae bacterium]
MSPLRAINPKGVQKRIWPALLVTPLVFPVLIILAWPFIYNFPPLNFGSYLKHLPAITFVVMFYGYPIGLVCVLIFGLPTWLIFKRLRVESVWAYAIAGAISLFILSTLMTTLSYFGGTVYPAGVRTFPLINESTPFFLVGGFVSGYVFGRLIQVRGEFVSD